MKLSPELRRVLAVGAVDAMAWIEKSKYPEYTRVSLTNAVDILSACLRVYDAEKSHRTAKKKQIGQRDRAPTWPSSSVKKKAVTIH